MWGTIDTLIVVVCWCRAKIGDTTIDDIGDGRLDVLARISSLGVIRVNLTMDTLVSRLRGTSDFLTNQMDAIRNNAANR